jgi:hypothetical protein
MTVAYLAWKCEKLLEVVGELFQGDWYNYILLFDPLFTLDFFIVLYLRPESFFYLPADSFISISAYHLGLVEYAF